ncbi:hypothetical protein HYQ45_010589 [Verticillium longisporum]|uniref:Uncharacterized protein n=1 Tax=Verticillium longisporum TaxID=100787 RepID=A0A8I3AM70_VERLO|nr:hypothetical protein HYQ45_010589 [Verticillium longisporum]
MPTPDHELKQELDPFQGVGGLISVESGPNYTAIGICALEDRVLPLLMGLGINGKLLNPITSPGLSPLRKSRTRNTVPQSIF